MRTIRIGIVGFGYMGKMHAMSYDVLRYYYKMNVNVKLYAVTTTKRPDELPVAFDKIYADYHELIADPNVDVVDICMPNIYHKEILLEAIKYNKHIYCEKPLALNLADSKAVMAAIAESNYNQTSRVTFEYRFVPAIMRAKTLIDEGAIGPIIHFSCKYYGSEFLDPMRPISWQSTKAFSGGGVLYALGTHSIDMIRYLIGEIDSVLATKSTYYTERPIKGELDKTAKVEIEDIVNAQLWCKKGAIGTLALSQVAAGAGVDFSFEIYGEKGAIKFDQANPNVLMFYDNTDVKNPNGGASGYKAIETMQKYDNAAIFPPPRVNIAWSRYHIASIYDFIKAVSEARSTAPDLKDGYEVMKITDAIYRSCESGKVERIEV